MNGQEVARAPPGDPGLRREPPDIKRLFDRGPPLEVVLPEVRRTRSHETGNGQHEPGRRRFRVWKTKFWKRREDYREQKAAIDSSWPVITPNQIQE